MSRVPPYSRNARAAPTLSPTGLSPATAARSSGLRLGWRFLTAWGAYRLPPDPVQPRRRNGGTLGTPTVWACTVSLAATPALSYFLRVREMFQFPGLPPPGLCVHPGVARLTTLRGSPIRRPSAPSPRAAPRGISLLRHVLLRHERPRHPPDALCHGRTPPRPTTGSPPSPSARATPRSSAHIPISPAHPAPCRACALLRSLLAPLLSRYIPSVARCGWERYHPPKGVSTPSPSARVKRACERWEDASKTTKCPAFSRSTSAHLLSECRPNSARKTLDIFHNWWYCLEVNVRLRGRETLLSNVDSGGRSIARRESGSISVRCV
jgi:hypothetical protein